MPTDGQIIQLEGNLGRDWVSKQVTVRESEVTLWKSSVAYNKTKDGPTTWFNLTIWPDRDTNSDGWGRMVASQTGKGAKVLVRGKVRVGEYKGQETYDISVWSIGAAIRPPLSESQVQDAFPGSTLEKPKYDDLEPF